jgi:hypothetical protein
MRIKIDEPVSLERLMAALIEAQIALGEDHVEFYNANLYFACS